MAWGIADVLSWYEALPQDVLDQWLAYDAVEPVGCDWERHASVMAMMEVTYAAIINPNLEKTDRIKPRKPEEFLPSGFRQAPKRPRKLTLAQQLAIVAKAYGGK